MSRPPRLFFHCYDHQKRLGGQKHVYAQVDALNQAGLVAYVVHAHSSLRLSWFANSTALIGRAEFTQLYDPSVDLLVLPEDLGPKLDAVPGRKVIFNKGIYNGFRALRPEPWLPSPYEHPSVVAALAVSEHNAEILRFAYPRLPVYVTSPGIDLTRFVAVALPNKRRQIAWVAKNASSVAAVQQILAARTRQGLNALADFSWVELADLNETELIETLQQSLLCVFLGVEEGFGLLPREATLCGCVTIAFDAGTLAGIPVGCRRVPGDLLGVAQRIEEVAALYPDRLSAWQAAVDCARGELSSASLVAAAMQAQVAWSALLQRLASDAMEHLESAASE